MTNTAKINKVKRHTPYVSYIISLVLILLYILPIFVLINGSFKDISTFHQYLKLPKSFNVEAYINALKDNSLWIGLRNSIILSIETVVICIFVASLAAYGIARSKKGIVNIVRNMNILVMMIPQIALLVGTYSLMIKLNLINKLFGLALLTATSSLPVTIFMYVNFITSIPVALDEAAMIDGAGVFRTYFTIIMPQLKAVTVTRVIVVAVNSWNSFLMPMFLLQSKSKQTIILVIRSLFSSQTGLGDFPAAFATCIISLIPVITVYLLLQKYIIEGQLGSSVK